MIDLMGGKCKHCGITDPRVLQVDHIHGNGRKDPNSNQTGASYCLRVIQSFLLEEDKYQILCANCNWIKKHEKGEVTKKYL